MVPNKRKWKQKIFIAADSSLSGEACLLWLLKYYCDPITKKELFTLSNQHKSTNVINQLLILASKTGFEVECWKADIETLQPLASPIILLINDQNSNGHGCLVLFETITTTQETTYKVFHPIQGIITMDAEQLNHIWVSRTFLSLKYIKPFIRQQEKKKLKKWFKESLNGHSWFSGFHFIISTFNYALLFTCLLLIRNITDIWLPKHNVNALNYAFGIIFLAVICILTFSFLLRSISTINLNTASAKQLNLFSEQLFSYSQETKEPKPVTSALIHHYANLLQPKKTLFTILQQSFIQVLVIIFTISYLATSVPVIIIPLFLLAISLYHYTKSINKDFFLKKEKQNNSTVQMLANFYDTLEDLDAIKEAQRATDYLHRARKRNYKHLDQIFNYERTQNRFSLIKGIGYAVVFFLTTLLNLQGLLQNILSNGQFLMNSGLTLCILWSIDKLSVCFIAYHELHTTAKNTNLVSSPLPESEMSKNISESYDSIQFEFIETSDFLLKFSAEKGIINKCYLKGSLQKDKLKAILLNPTIAQLNSITINNTFTPCKDRITDWNKAIALIPSNPFIFKSSIAENIAFNDVIPYKEALLNLLATYELNDYIKQFPDSLATQLNENGYQLSPADKIIIAILRGLYRGARIIVIEQVPQNPSKEKRLEKLLDKIKQDIIVIILTEKSTIMDKQNHEVLFSN